MKFPPGSSRLISRQKQIAASLLLHAGKAQLLRYSVHCTQADMLRIAAQNHFDQIIAYNSDFAPTKKVYEV